MSGFVADVEGALAKIKDKAWVVGIVGLGYVGLPLALAFAQNGFKVVGFDIDPTKVDLLNAGGSYFKHIPASKISPRVQDKSFSATADFSKLPSVDAIIICVPTPLTRHREPDMSYIVSTTEEIQKFLRPGHIVILESTTYPGTTREVVRPILERTGLASGRDFFLAYSPEREDPGNIDFETSRIPKVVGGDGDAAKRLAVALYSRAVIDTVPTSSVDTAEAVKLTENIFRAVNIALVNELKTIYAKMGINIWEVIEAAKTKPFGFMPFYPGPGLGGHCIPIDPFYLTWKAREFEISARFIELAGEINTAMPAYVVDRLAEALNMSASKALQGARILLVGLAYKKNVEDVRESPAFKLVSLIKAKGGLVEYYDPYVDKVPVTREHPELAGQQSVRFEPAVLESFDAAVICTDHDNVDYDALVKHSKIVVDTRNATSRVTAVGAKIYQA